MHVTYIVCIYIHCVYTYIYIYMLGTNILHIHITYILTRTLLPSHQNIQISMHICSPLYIHARSCEYSLFVQVQVLTLWSKKNLKKKAERRSMWGESIASEDDVFDVSVRVCVRICV